MKNLVLISIVMIGMSIFMSCNKENGEIEQLKTSENTYAFDVSNDNGVLNFETKEDFELALNYLAELEKNDELNKFETDLNFESYRLAFKESKEKMDEIEDDLLSVFLNPANKVIVGNQLFEINMKTEKVSVWDYQESDLKSASSDYLIGVFSCNDDVFDLLDGTQLKSVAGDYCSSKTLSYDKSVFYGTANEYLVDYSMHNRYVKAGIYHTLNARIKQKVNRHSTIKIYVSTCKFKRKDQPEDNLGTHSESGINWERNYRPYFGTRRLESYTFNVKFSGTYNGETLMSKSLNISCS